MFYPVVLYLDKVIKVVPQSQVMPFGTTSNCIYTIECHILFYVCIYQFGINYLLTTYLNIFEKLSTPMAQWSRGHASEPKGHEFEPTGAIWCGHMVVDMSK